jgi:pyruvate/2-oxoglutarate dehydrogenase complex dihydrolipoamide acyltransferase (E2) component
MPTVTMPQLGESVAEGTIGKWLKNVGDHVDKYEPIVEVITDKVNAEVPSPFEGTLTRILVQEGDTVPNNAEIAVVEAAGETAAQGGEPAPAVPETEPTPEAPPREPTPEATPANTAAAEAPSDSTPPPTVPVEAQEELRPAAVATNGTAASEVATYEGRMTPAVRRLAREHGIDLTQVAGTGHGGRVTREDVTKFIEAGGAAATASAGAGAPASAPAPATAPGAPTPTAPAPAPSAPAAAPSPVAEGDSLKPASPMRKAIAAQMTRSLAAPVAYTTVEVDMSGVVRVRDAQKRAYQAREGIGLSFVAFVTKASVEGLRKHPDINGHYTDEGHWRRKRINVGVAVAVDDGLVVPVIQDADGLSLHGLNRAIYDLADRSRNNRLKLDDVQGGTFTVDNTGWTGSILTQPIINVPEVAILTMEAIVKRPVVVESPAGDSIAIRPMMNMVLGFDHRATDGAQAGAFLADIKRWLESVDDQTAIG